MNITNKKWLVGSLLFFLLIWGLTILNQHKPSNDHEIIFTDVGFDTPITFYAQCSDKEFEQYTQIVEKIYKENHKRFDFYHSYKNLENLYTLNQKKEKVKMDSTFIDCFQLSADIHKSLPSFDSSTGTILSLWHETRETKILPTQDMIENARKHVGMDKIQIEGNYITYLDSNLLLDLGGIAKGYTTQLAKEALEKAGCKHGFINAGGNVILIGNKEDGSQWTIGIQNPDKNESILSIQAKKDQTFVTSGDYQRTVEIEGKQYNHIIDPQTGYPAQIMRSVTVITNQESGWADGVSTALFCMNYEDGKNWAQEQGIDCVWIFDKENAPKEKKKKKSGNLYIYTTPDLNIQ